MHYTRIYTDPSGESCFEKTEVPLENSGMFGYISKKYKVKNLIFRENKHDYDWDFHNAPARQFIILLDGEIEITTSKGDSCRFSGGDVLLVEDTSGKGHKTRHVVQHIRQSVVIEI